MSLYVALCLGRYRRDELDRVRVTRCHVSVAAGCWGVSTLYTILRGWTLGQLKAHIRSWLWGNQARPGVQLHLLEQEGGDLACYMPEKTQECQ